jgi:hypothetical protein
MKGTIYAIDCRRKSERKLRYYQCTSNDPGQYLSLVTRQSEHKILAKNFVLLYNIIQRQVVSSLSHFDASYELSSEANHSP